MRAHSTGSHAPSSHKFGLLGILASLAILLLPLAAGQVEGENSGYTIEYEVIGVKISHASLAEVNLRGPSTLLEGQYAYSELVAYDHPPANRNLAAETLQIYGARNPFYFTPQLGQKYKFQNPKQNSAPN